MVDPPTFKMQGEISRKVNESDSVTLICGRNLQSNPRSTITWFDPNGTKVVATENYSQDDRTDVVLNIKKVDRRYRGQWTCVLDVNAYIYNCLDDEKMLSGDHDGQLPQTECTWKSLTKTNIINLDVLCKYK